MKTDNKKVEARIAELMDGTDISRTLAEEIAMFEFGLLRPDVIILDEDGNEIPWEPEPLE